MHSLCLCRRRSPAERLKTSSSERNGMHSSFELALAVDTLTAFSRKAKTLLCFPSRLGSSIHLIESGVRAARRTGRVHFVHTESTKRWRRWNEMCTKTALTDLRLAHKLLNMVQQCSTQQRHYTICRALERQWAHNGFLSERASCAHRKWIVSFVCHRRRRRRGRGYCCWCRRLTATMPFNHFNLTHNIYHVPLSFRPTTVHLISFHFNLNVKMYGRQTLHDHIRVSQQLHRGRRHVIRNVNVLRFWIIMMLMPRNDPLIIMILSLISFRVWPSLFECESVNLVFCIHKRARGTSVHTHTHTAIYKT